MAEQDLVTLQTRVTKDIADELDRWARQEDRSIASLLRLIILMALERRESCGSHSE